MRFLILTFTLLFTLNSFSQKDARLYDKSFKYDKNIKNNYWLIKADLTEALLANYKRKSKNFKDQYYIAYYRPRIYYQLGLLEFKNKNFEYALENFDNALRFKNNVESDDGVYQNINKYRTQTLKALKD